MSDKGASVNHKKGSATIHIYTSNTYKSMPMFDSAVNVDANPRPPRFGRALTYYTGPTDRTPLSSACGLANYKYQIN